MEGIGNLLLEDSPLYGVVVKHAFAKTVGKPFGRTHAAGPAPDAVRWPRPGIPEITKS